MDTDQTLNDAAIQFANELAGDGPPRLDPAFLLFLKELLMEFLPVLIDMCNETTETVPSACREMKDGRPIRHWIGMRKVRRSVGRRVLRAEGLNAVQLLDAMLEVGATAQPDQVKAIYDECKDGCDYC